MVKRGKEVKNRALLKFVVEVTEVFFKSSAILKFLALSRARVHNAITSTLLFFQTVT